MIQIRIHVLCRVLEYFQEIEFEGKVHFHFVDSLKLPSLDRLPEETIKIIQEQLSDIKSEFENMEFPGVLEQLQYILDNVNTISLVRFHENIKSLNYLIKKELAKQFFVFIPRDNAFWYNKKDGFGSEVSNAFASAREDIIEAGNCYATDHYTACVFHLMRVLEHGLRAFAKDVGLPFDVQQWYDIINQIEKEIKKAQNLPKSIEKSERLQFLSEAAKEFSYFKDGWRNYVSHGRSKYDGPQALSTLNHVKAFMIHLSTQLSE